MILLAILLPGISFLVRGKIIQAIVALVLQIVAFLTFILFGLGFIIWIALAIWAVSSYNSGKAKKRHQEILETLQMRSNP